MLADEAIIKLKSLLSEPSTLTLDKLEQLMNQVSVSDPFGGVDATTEKCYSIQWMDNYLYGGLTEGSTGPWADASKRLAQETSGNVVCIVPNAGLDRTWVTVEMPNILKNPNVTSINGMPKELFSREWHDILKSADFDSLGTNSRFKKLINVIKSESGNSFSRRAFRDFLLSK